MSDDNQTAGPAPDTAEDPSRKVVSDAKAPNFAGFPKTKFHPVYGARMVNDPNEEASLPQPLRNWFDTAEEADAHRTQREAEQAMHYNNRVKVDGAMKEDGTADLSDPAVMGDAGIVRNSVSATESLKSGFGEPL
jgi:hypothetical protein